MKKIKTGIIGCGHIGQMHIKNLRQLESENNLVSVTGLFDIDNTKASMVSKESGINMFFSLDELLENVDAALITTPTSTHFEIAKRTISEGINTFIEKPLTDRIEDSKELLELSRVNDVKIQIGHIERFNPAILSLKKFELKPLFIESHRLSQFNPRGTDVSVILDLMIHDLDLLLYIMHSEVISVDADGASILTDKIDIANARIKFENGCIANITASRISQKKMRKMRIFQRNAYISIDFSKNISEIFRLSDCDKITTDSNSTRVVDSISYQGKIYNILYEIPDVENINPMKYELSKFFECIIDNKETEVNINDGIQALKLAEIVISKINNSHK